MSAQMSWEMPGSAHGVCHSGRVSRFAIAHVGLGVEMCAGKVEYTAWEGDRLRRCQKKCGEVRMEDAVQSVSQGLSAQMSGEMRRSAHGGCRTKRESRFVCADVKRNTEKCAWRMPYKAYVDGCLRRCRVKGEEENMGGEETDSSLALRMTKGRSV